MENVEIKNKNIFLNLSEGEEILYMGKKDTATFYISVTVVIFICVGMIFLLAKLFFTQNMSILLSNYPEFKFIIIGMLLFIVAFACILYKYISDYFFTDVVLTNQRILFSIKNNTLSVKYEDVNRVSNCVWKGPQGIIINSNIRLTKYFNPLFITSNKQFLIYFINYAEISNKLNEISPNIADIPIKMTLKDAIVIVLVLILMFASKVFSHR